MVTLGRILLGVFFVFFLLSVILFGGSIGGFFDSGGYVIAAAIAVILFWGVFGVLSFRTLLLANALAGGTGDSDKTLTWSNWLFFVATILAPVTGLALGFLAFVGCGPLWLSSLYHWVGMIATILAFLAFFLLPVIVRACIGGTEGHAAYHRWYWVVFMPLLVVVIWGLAWLIPYLKLKGDINESEYAASDRVYQLPFPGGESTWVIQGNNSSLNHNNQSGNSEKFAWDFRRRCGTPVLASRAGTIQGVTDTNDGIGGSNNQISIAHPDGSVSFYLHIEKGSVPTRFRTAGTPVAQGDEIAKVGSVGNSMTGHIHFHVKRGGSTIGARFTDVSEDNGIPRTFNSYTSGNRRVP